MQNRVTEISKAKTPIMFVGSKSFGLQIFQSLYSNDSTIEWIVIHPEDSKDDRSSLNDFKDFCLEKKIEFTVGNSKSLLTQKIAKCKPNLVLVCGWYSILPEEILELVPGGFWGIHHSLLPRYRGGAPLVWSILKGDPVVGSTIFKFDSGIDSGPILSQVALEISENENITVVSKKLNQLVIDEIVRCWPTLKSGRIETIAQDDKQASYSAQRLPVDSKINWQLDAKQIHNFIRAQQFPYPIAHSNLKGQKVEILKSAALKLKYHGNPGQIISKNLEGIIVTCGSDSGLLITELMLDEARFTPTDFPIFLRGRFESLDE